MRRTLLFSILSVLALGPAAVAHAGTTVVASGLDNPRGIDVDRHGFVYVAEAGRGGSGPCIPGAEGPTQCIGRTGAITLVAYGKQQRIVSGLPSVADEGTGASALGPQDVDVGPLGFGSFVTGLGNDPSVRAQLGAGGSGLAELFAFTPHGDVVERADLGTYEAEHDPDADQPGSVHPDSNPTSVLKAGRGDVAVDAGGNDLLRVRANGRIKTLAVFPSRFVDAPPPLGLAPGTQIPMQAVPTAVTRGPDRAFYVSQLTGFPFPAGAANVYRVVPGSPPEIYASGLTNVTDLAFDAGGSLYVVEHAKNGLLSGDPSGEVIAIAPDGTRTSVASDGLVEPYGIAIGRRGEIYVTNKSRRSGEGEVLRLR
ncbi:MAG TPA: ScyD/ScyE family protein [Solirubrobacteraceae bacterium]